jgi:hypothetical protein
MRQKTVKSGQIRKEKNKYFYSKVTTHRHPVSHPPSPVPFATVHPPWAIVPVAPSNRDDCPNQQSAIKNPKSTLLFLALENSKTIQ